MAETPYRQAAAIDFDAWSAVARNDPAAFEALRSEAIEAAIARAPAASRDRLRCLQWRIDQERRLAPTPLAACERISRMMWQRVAGPAGLTERLGELRDLLESAVGKATAEARDADQALPVGD